MKQPKAFILFLCLIFLPGCVYTAEPIFYNGAYYMVGDSACRNGRGINSTTIICYNEQGKSTGYRQAMTQQQLSMYMHQQQMQLAQQSMIQQQNIANQAIINQNNAILMQQANKDWRNINSNMGCGWARQC
ncbi:hypothetical protein BBC0244_020400 [Bartonella apihabitans]|uniref:hypothetical protein n=1 Tax=Bartonella apihabitans TaxID=2750929 RepID=UPI00098FB169|nr:hypothetical protein [Bartonella apihabitans]AQT45704.1 hypothetical protein BBC0244_020400 [Bartonella apihabitans]